MITDELKYRIREAFGHVPTAEQEQAIETFALFMTDRCPCHAVVEAADGAHGPYGTCCQGVLAVC